MNVQHRLASALLGATLLVSSHALAREYVVKKGLESFRSATLEAEIQIVPGVVVPARSEQIMAPFLTSHPEIVAGRSVLVLDAGCGLTALVAAKLGAARVVASDTRQTALDCTGRNARKLGIETPIETRRVPEDAKSPFAALEPDAKFDVIIAEASHALDLQSEAAPTPLLHGHTDLPIVTGLAQRLTPNGVAILRYPEMFHHMLLVKYARAIGFEVRHHRPETISSQELASVFNLYLARLLEAEKLPSDAFRFARTDTLGDITLANDFEPFDAEKSTRRYPGVALLRPGAETAP